MNTCKHETPHSGRLCTQCYNLRRLEINIRMNALKEAANTLRKFSEAMGRVNPNITKVIKDAES